ncbi:MULTISPECIES: DsbA family protein [unclassified Mesorhizobium]|uniref:DsbA family oxidoreductase n=2 Tax=Mesorhizobium TaxID=68287 RepID=UPI000F74E8A5|nr:MULTISPECIES: DsbA family protein [unclassified Mesorhizobium]AZO07134.1 DsbA family protein [Mesorhizobium sp. M2A.F.Ca.ET.043.02.1.1]RUW40751.1 DsbA family protein [Mesorhizobium sp. M2A.F.Ca.ET.015.02.1.1]RUW67510.1 DsbA family protein [Mesorhizobium sp. M2A.F.Ca.ET.067.02.1.1]RVC93702.1 DsbA family protein [Mesorhizobium sp. M2A.F.Ca.ET.017.03.2.1]RWB47419.1 MAG: DsbA family protein [Mesorhizobium sp.]
MSAENSITVDVVSDVVCPWCFIGQKRLDKAIAAASDVDVRVSWRPFQLDPTIPPGGMDRRQYMLGKFGSEERIQQIHARIEPLGEAEGIHFAFGAIKVAANTLDAHRVIRWAGAAGEDVQNRLVRRLFQLNFEEGANIGDHAVLVKAAGEAGMDASVVETLLPTDADVEAVRNEITTASRMGITGVPCFLLEGKYAVMGAQDADTLADAIRQVAQAKARGELETVAD